MSPKRVVVWEHIDESGIELMRGSHGVELIYFDGNPVSEAESYNALEEAGAVMIRGAGLDVCVEEPPLPDNNPLLTLDNIMVSPHIAGGTKESMVKTATQAAEEILRTLSGERPKFAINPEIYEASP